MCLIPFAVKIEELKIDKELPSKLFAELPGIPHGMKLEKHPLTNPKVNLHKTLKTQEVEARKKSKLADVESRRLHHFGNAI